MKRLSVEYTIKIRKILIIALIWTIIGSIIALYDYFNLHSQISVGLVPDYSLVKMLFINCMAGLLGALIGGSFLVFYVNEKFREKPYWISILLVACGLIFTLTLVTILLSLLVAPSTTHKPLSDPLTWQAIEEFIIDETYVKNLIVWSVIVSLTQLMLQINDKFGQGILWNIIRGRYHTPREETRIFMFVDIIASTAIAEKLNNEKYHMLLKDFYADITDAIVYNKGEIYQYVGDQIIISWKLDAGIQNTNCLKCYFDIRQKITDLKDKYLSKYGLLPDFKAGLHYGKVIAGEIGIIKRDITFSGDVLNTAYRIQSKCTEYKVKILSSDELLRLLPNSSKYNPQSIGDVELRGKEGKVALSTLTLQSS